MTAEASAVIVGIGFDKDARDFGVTVSDYFFQAVHCRHDIANGKTLRKLNIQVEEHFVRAKIHGRLGRIYKARAPLASRKRVPQIFTLLYLQHAHRVFPARRCCLA